jgi:uncharacterized protein YmfQ (DUF2313 family)
MEQPPSDTWIQRTAAEYAQAFSALLPRGAAWPREPDHVLQRVISGLAGIWGDPVETLAALLLTQESDPRATVVLLPDWERAWGLPDKCLAEPLTIANRQVALVAKMTLLGAQSRAFFIAEALAIGYTITIREFSPFMAGVSRCGDTRNLAIPGDVADGIHYRWEIGPPEMRFYWVVVVGALRLTWFRAAQSQAGVDPMVRIALATDLECLIRRYKPAHTDVIFDYSSLFALDFSEPFDSGYLLLGLP